MNMTTNQEDYYRDLRKRQEDHLRRVRGEERWKPCAHDQCPSCHGTGIKIGGGACVHGIACDCPKCSPGSFYAPVIT